MCLAVDVSKSLAHCTLEDINMYDGQHQQSILHLFAMPISFPAESLSFHNFNDIKKFVISSIERFQINALSEYVGYFQECFHYFITSNVELLFQSLLSVLYYKILLVEQIVQFAHKIS